MIQPIISSFPEDQKNQVRGQDQAIADKEIQGVNSQVAHKKGNGQVSYRRRGDKTGGDQKPIVLSCRQEVTGLQ
jgi:hypothetical protein